jgi:hypothetical protein
VQHRIGQPVPMSLSTFLAMGGCVTSILGLAARILCL